MKSGFWEKPTPWASFILLLSLAIFTASMLTMREGHRFQSRPFRPHEIRLVEAALNLWDEPEAPKMKAMLTGGRLRAMDKDSFGRAQERSAFGYSDEWGRILVNPHLCFAYAEHLGGEAQPVDLVATASTLYHESRHLFVCAPESCAYEEEWQFLRRLRERHPELEKEVAAFESDMPDRIRIYVGPKALEFIQSRLSEGSANAGG